MSVSATAKDKTSKKNDMKARSLLLMALSNKHQLTFSQYNDAKTILQMIVSRLAILGVVITQEDLNSKFLRSLPPEWNTYALEQIHKDDLEAMDLRWQLSLLSMSAKRYFQRTENKIFINADDTASEEVAVLKREVACKEYEINRLRSEFEKVKQEKKGIEFKIRKFDNASKNLDKLKGSQITNNGKKGLGYDSVPPPHPLIYNGPTKLDLSYSGLDEFKEPKFKDYGPRDKDTSSFVESPLNVDKETTISADKKIEFVKPKHHEKLVRRSVSGCARHMTGKIAYLLDFKEFDGGYVTFGGGAHSGRISGKGKFDGKSDEGFFVGYSLSSKAFKVYNTRTKKVEENLHIGFLENNPMIEGNGPKWMLKMVHIMRMMTKISLKMIAVLRKLMLQGKHFNTATLEVNTGRFELNNVDSSLNTTSSSDPYSPTYMLKLGASDTPEATHIEFLNDRDAPEVDLGNIPNFYEVSTTLHTRIHKDNPIENIEPISIAKALSDSSWVEAIQKELLNKARLVSQGHRQEEDVKSVSTLVILEKPLVKDGYANDVDVHLYISMIGSLMYPTASRLDIMFAVCASARFQVTPKTSHLLAIKRIFRYLKGKPTLGLWYPRDSPFELVSYTDSEYDRATQDKKSTTGGNSKEVGTLRYLSLVVPLINAGDKAVHKEWGDRMERVATTASSLEVEHDNGSGPRCQDTILGM
uniref:Retroviral polymerase SH3-like domain-containing protein n=1 Tax=Tanacetum cinerariifolium TaxID=118510 RepID=A0A6L2K8R3_TANCI|nr:hypothetical protein [Tanacetum cinerariifolium]